MENKAPESSGNRNIGAKGYDGGRKGERTRKYTSSKREYKKECTVKIVKIGKTSETPSKIIKAVEDVCGVNTVLAVVPDDMEDSYCITMDSEQNADKLTRGVNIESKNYDCLFLFDNSVIVSFIHLPAHLSDELILDVLREKNCKPLSQVFRHVHPGTEVADGTRYVRVQFPPGLISLPWSIKFDTGLGTRSFRVKHDHQRQLCNYCGSPGHKYRQCLQLVCYNCDKHGHKENECKIPPCQRCKKRLRHCECKETKCQYCNKEICECPCFTCDQSKEECRCKCRECGIVTARCACRKGYTGRGREFRGKEKEEESHDSDQISRENGDREDLEGTYSDEDENGGDSVQIENKRDNKCDDKQSLEGEVSVNIRNETTDVVFGATVENDDMVFGTTAKKGDVVFGTTEERTKVFGANANDGKLKKSMNDKNVVFGASDNRDKVFGTEGNKSVDKQCTGDLVEDESMIEKTKGQKRQRNEISRACDSDDEIVIINKHIVTQNDIKENSFDSDDMETDISSSDCNTGVDVANDAKDNLSCSQSSGTSTVDLGPPEGKKRRNRMKFYPNINSVQKDKLNQKNVNNGDV